jgi:putative transposase
MPDHFHLILSPSNDTSLERAMQLTRGGFSFRYGKEISRREIWQKGYTDHRIRNQEDFITHQTYIEQNSVRAGLVSHANEYKYGSAYPGYRLDASPFLSG